MREVQLINRTAYQNAREERMKALKELPFEISSDSATENAGRNGYNLQEMTSHYDSRLPDSLYKEYEGEEEQDTEEVMSMLVELGDLLDEKSEEKYANFIDLLILKVADDSKKSYLEKFNDLLIKINNTDIPETNDTIKKLTKIFSRTVMLERESGRSLSEAYESAYKKTLNRADQFLSGGRMIKSANIYNNPAIVADQIKGVIDVLVSRFSPEARLNSYPNIRKKVMKLNPSELSSKKSPGGAAIGVAITLIKNILNGRDPHFINLVVTNLVRIL